VTALAADDAWAVGSNIQHWDGQAWSVVPAPAGTYRGIAAVNARDIWAVGSDPSGGSLIAHYTDQQLFEDTPPSNTFYPYVQWMACRGYIQGYPCGGVGEPCQPPGNRPYFRPIDSDTRGQVSKIVTIAYGGP
jgi:hypothetical protein